MSLVESFRIHCGACFFRACFRRLTQTLALIAVSSIGLYLNPPCTGQEVSQVFAPPPSSAPGSVEDKLKQMNELVEQFSSDQFAVREAASEKMTEIFDDSMLPQMQAIAKTLSDPEARVRLNAIIAKVKYERLQTQIRSFIRARDPKETSGFDGWKSFSKYAGESRSAKQLFLKLLDRYPELVETELSTKESAVEKTKTIASVIGQFLSQNQPYEQEDAIALLYCINASEELYDKRLERISLFTFRVAPFSLLLNEVRFRKSIEPMMTAWASRVEDSRLECLLIFLEKELPNARALALGILNSPSALENEDAFLIAMQTMYRFGLKEDLPAIEKWLDDKSVCYMSQFSPYSVQRRDVALIASMRIGGEDPRKIFPQFASHPLRGFNQESIAGPDDEPADQLRTQRIEEWKNNRKPAG